MYGYTVSCAMQTANESYAQVEGSDALRSRLALHFMLAGGAGLLGLVTWLLTL